MKPRTLAMTALLFGLAAGNLACSTSRAESGRIDGETARKLVAGGAKLVDVRTAAEFAEGHLEGALLIPFDEIGARASEIGSAQQATVVYCRSGRRSAIARQKLLELGFTTVYDLGPKSAW